MFWITQCIYRTASKETEAETVKFKKDYYETEERQLCAVNMAMNIIFPVLGLE